MSELACGGCFTMLVHNRGATNIRCPHCGRVNSTRSGKTSSLQRPAKNHHHAGLEWLMQTVTTNNKQLPSQTERNKKKTVSVALICKFSPTDRRFLLLIVKQRTRLVTCHAGIAGLLWRTHREPRRSDAQLVAASILSGCVANLAQYPCSLLN